MQLECNISSSRELVLVTHQDVHGLGAEVIQDDGELFQPFVSVFPDCHIHWIRPPSQPNVVSESAKPLAFILKC